jgi:hypothetical protein
MRKGFDCATSLSTAQARAFAADGYEFVCRYLVPSGWKRLTKEEANAISGSGLQIISVFEISGNRASMSAEQGNTDGLSALQVARDIGQPEGSTIYFAIDFDAQASDMDAIEAYIRAAAIATPGYPTGVYGSFAVVEEMLKRNACSHFWQTYAWSNGQITNGIMIYQNQNDITIHGIGVDVDEAYGNEGGWTTMPLLSIDDANKLIGLLSEAYKLGVTQIPLPDGTKIIVDQSELHRLANVMRTASNQPTT